jgi:D-hydroxyproline dehydrogenase subunit gamma
MQPDGINLSVNGRWICVNAGTTVAAAILISGETTLRRSITGEPRGPVCGMGVCYECRVDIDGLRHCRSCQIVCRSGMQVVTG